MCSTANLALVQSLGADAVIDYTREDFTTGSARYDLVFNAVGKRKARLLSRDPVLLKELFEAGRIRAVIDRTWPLEGIAEAHAYVDQGHKKGNVVITV